MDPLRRFILLAIVASVVMAEPTQACALLSARAEHSDRQHASATERFIRQLAVVLRQTVKPAVQGLRKWSQPRVLIAFLAPLDERRSRTILLPHLSDLPPPLG